MKNPGLWRRLQNHEFDDGTPLLSFRQRLTLETGWTREFAIRAIEEYQKFIYLVAMSKEQLTPSTIIDEVWHLHLTYTRNYWDEMCAKVIGKPIHHTPTAGGFAEEQKFADAYLATLALYQREFSTTAPAEFWPHSHTAIVQSPLPTYNPKHHLLLPRVVFSILGSAGTILVALAVSIGSTVSWPLGILGGTALLVGGLGSNWGDFRGNKGSGSCGADAGTCSGHGGGHGGGSCGGHGGSCGGSH